MVDEYVKGKEIGKVIQGLKDLGRTVDTGFATMNKKFDNLDCSSNNEKLTLLFEDYTDRKETKKIIIRETIKKAIPVIFKYGSVICVLSGVAYAFAKG